jgi:hypothetical protein
MPSPPPRRLAFGLDLGPSGTYLLCPPLGSVVGRGIRVRHWRVFWGRIASASDARSFSLVFLSFCRLALGLCVLVFLLALCLSAICIIDISVDKLCGSLYESEKCVRARRATSLRFYPMARVGFRETCVRMPHGSAYPSPSSCALQVLWPPR